MKRVLNSIFVVLLFSSCGSLISDPDPVYESAIRHYAESWSAIPDVVRLTVEGEHPSENLLNRLDDIGINLTGNNPGNDSNDANLEPGFYKDLSVSNVRWRGPGTVTLVISYTITTPDGYTDAHGIEYRLEKVGGSWTVTHEGAEWMS